MELMFSKPNSIINVIGLSSSVNKRYVYTLAAAFNNMGYTNMNQ